MIKIQIIIPDDKEDQFLPAFLRAAPIPHLASGEPLFPPHDWPQQWALLMFRTKYRQGQELLLRDNLPSDPNILTST